MNITFAIVGRPNVGKSTLFNRMVRRRRDLAIVNPEPGVTRDRRVAPAKFFDLEFFLIDTAGFEDEADDTIEHRMQTQSVQAMDDADVLIFVVDARSGITPYDHQYAQLVREQKKPVILVANKTEATSEFYEAMELGLGEAILVSAEHGQGMTDLRDQMYEEERKFFPDEVLDDPDAEKKKPIELAIVGRPNVGKSTLINQLLETERVITGPEAGLTRDAIAIEWDYEGQPVRLIDTAGIRKKQQVIEDLEKKIVQDSLEAIQYAQTVALMIDGRDLFEKQDLKIAELVAKEGRALIILVNKWDLVKEKDKTKKELRYQLEESLHQCKDIPMIFISALKGWDCNEIMPAVLSVYDQWNRRLPTGELNRWLFEVTQMHPPPLNKGRQIRVRYITQVKTRPPRFALWINYPEALPESYLRYLSNRLREDFELKATVIRMLPRKGKNPYEKRKK